MLFIESIDLKFLLFTIILLTLAKLIGACQIALIRNVFIISANFTVEGPHFELVDLDIFVASAFCSENGVYAPNYFINYIIIICHWI